MAEKDQGNEDDLNLELPSLPFGRRRKRRAGAASGDAGAPTPAKEPAERPAETPREETRQTGSTDATAVGPAPVADDATDVLPQTPGRFAPPPASPGTAHEPAPAPYVAPETLGADDRATRPDPAPRQPFEDDGDDGDDADDEATAALPPTPETGSTAQAAKAAPTTAAKPPKPEKPAARTRQMPHLPGPAAAVLVGAFLGILACGATYAGLLGCQEIQGTSSCGGPGFVILVAIMVLLIWVGGRLLRLLGVDEPGSTSFLGVGLMAVVALAFLIDVIFEWWMILVIPGVTALTFAGAHWLTSRFSETADH